MGDGSPLLLIAATERELGEQAGLVCGVGPVESAVRTAAFLAESRPSAVLHIGIAGGRRFTPGTIVLGAEALYTDVEAAFPIGEVVSADAQLLQFVRGVLPEAPVLAIGTSASVGSLPPHLGVEAMEGFGVLRACELAGVPAVELRSISNAIGEADRRRWHVDRALESLAAAVRDVVAAYPDFAFG